VSKKRHSTDSSQREKTIEHLFVGELLKDTWRKNSCLSDARIEVSKPEVDNSGYDIILEKDNIIRHIQIKASHKGATTSKQTFQEALVEKPSACIVWIFFDDEFNLGPYYYFGKKAGKPLPVSVLKLDTPCNTRANSHGHKKPRIHHRQVKKSEFRKIEYKEELYKVLFNPNHPLPKKPSPKNNKKNTRHQNKRQKR